MGAMKKAIKWNLEKARLLKGDKDRGGVSFEECVVAIESGKVLDNIKNPSSNHPNQGMYILNIDDYAYSVPYVVNEDEIFLKTVYPSRRFTALYMDKKEL